MIEWLYTSLTDEVSFLISYRHDLYRMVVGFTMTYAISAYYQSSCEFKSRSGEVYSIQHYVIKFVSDLWQVSGFLRALRFPPPNKTDRHDITEIVLKVVLTTITITFNPSILIIFFSPIHKKSLKIPLG